MRIVHHGGQCCGIKTIKGFPILPELEMEPKPELVGAVERDTAIHTDVRGQTVSSDVNFYVDELPRERAIQRFDRYLDYICKMRPNHIIEVVIACYREPGKPFPEFVRGFQAPWIPVFRQRGFKESVRSINSNSGNAVLVFHAVVKDGKIEGADYVKSYEENPKAEASVDLFDLTQGD